MRVSSELPQISDYSITYEQPWHGFHAVGLWSMVVLSVKATQTTDKGSPHTPIQRSASSYCPLGARAG